MLFRLFTRCLGTGDKRLLNDRGERQSRAECAIECSVYVRRYRGYTPLAGHALHRHHHAAPRNYADGELRRRARER